MGYVIKGISPLPSPPHIKPKPKPTPTGKSLSPRLPSPTYLNPSCNKEHRGTVRDGFAKVSGEQSWFLDESGIYGGVRWGGGGGKERGWIGWVRLYWKKGVSSGQIRMGLGLRLSGDGEGDGMGWDEDEMGLRVGLRGDEMGWGGMEMMRRDKIK